MGNVISPGTSSFFDAIAEGDAEAAVGALQSHPELIRKRLGTKRRNLYHLCSAKGRLEALERLCEHVWRTVPDEAGGVHADGPLPRGRTHPEILPAVNAYDQKGMTPLSLACKRGHAQVVGFLISQGADPYLKDRQLGRTPLHHAARGNYPECIDAILTSPVVAEEAKSRSPPEDRLVDLPNNAGYTALHYAAASFATEAAAALLRHGADPNAKTTDVGFDFLALDRGSTPLHAAARLHSLEVATLLLRHWYDNLKELDVTDPRVVDNHLKIKPYQTPGVKLNRLLFRVLDPATPIKEIIGPAGKSRSGGGGGGQVAGSWETPAAKKASGAQRRVNSESECQSQESDHSDGSSGDSGIRHLDAPALGGRHKPSCGAVPDGQSERRSWPEERPSGLRARGPHAGSQALVPGGFECGSSKTITGEAAAGASDRILVARRPTELGVLPPHAARSERSSKNHQPKEAFPEAPDAAPASSRRGSKPPQRPWTGASSLRQLILPKHSHVHASDGGCGVGGSQQRGATKPQEVRTEPAAEPEGPVTKPRVQVASSGRAARPSALAAWEAVESGDPSRPAAAGGAAGAAAPAAAARALDDTDRNRGGPDHSSADDCADEDQQEGHKPATATRRSLGKKISRKLSSLAGLGGFTAGRSNAVTACGPEAAPSPRRQAKAREGHSEAGGGQPWAASRDSAWADLCSPAAQK